MCCPGCDCHICPQRLKLPLFARPLVSLEKTLASEEAFMLSRRYLLRKQPTGVGVGDASSGRMSRLSLRSAFGMLATSMHFTWPLADGGPPVDAPFLLR